MTPCAQVQHIVRNRAPPVTGHGGQRFGLNATTAREFPRPRRRPKEPGSLRSQLSGEFGDVRKQFCGASDPRHVHLAERCKLLKLVASVRARGVGRQKNVSSRLVPLRSIPTSGGRGAPDKTFRVVPQLVNPVDPVLFLHGNRERVPPSDEHGGGQFGVHRRTAGGPLADGRKSRIQQGFGRACVQRQLFKWCSSVCNAVPSDRAQAEKSDGTREGRGDLTRRRGGRHERLTADVGAPGSGQLPRADSQYPDTIVLYSIHGRSVAQGAV
jgi:hypothetical protein